MALGRLSAGSLSLDNNGRSAAWWLYQGMSAGPRVWTCEIDGSSSFSVSRGDLRRQAGEGGGEMNVGRLEGSGKPQSREMEISKRQVALRDNEMQRAEQQTTGLRANADARRGENGINRSSQVVKGHKRSLQCPDCRSGSRSRSRSGNWSCREEQQHAIIK